MIIFVWIKTGTRAQTWKGCENVLACSRVTWRNVDQCMRGQFTKYYTTLNISTLHVRQEQSNHIEWAYAFPCYAKRLYIDLVLCLTVCISSSTENNTGPVYY